jgi:hypothetical protein
MPCTKLRSLPPRPVLRPLLIPVCEPLPPPVVDRQRQILRRQQRSPRVEVNRVGLGESRLAHARYQPREVLPLAVDDGVQALALLVREVGGIHATTVAVPTGAGNGDGAN